MGLQYFQVLPVKAFTVFPTVFPESLLTYFCSELTVLHACVIIDFSINIIFFHLISCLVLLDFSHCLKTVFVTKEKKERDNKRTAPSVGAGEVRARPTERACPMGFKWTVKVSDFMSANLSLLSTSGSVCRLITIIRHFPL